jgi:ABC-type sulfate transport system permease component
MLFNGYSAINSIATSFLCAWAATWFELLLGVIDHYYMKIYENFYTKTTDTEDTKEKMSEVREINEEQ